MTTFKQRLWLGLGACSLGLAGLVQAQSSAPASGAPATHAMARDPAAMAEKMRQRMAKHMAEMHDKLKITAAQEAAWKTFTDAMTPASMPAPMDRQALDKMTTPERMEKALERMQEHQSKMQSRLSALKSFYAQLAPEQQKIFDDSHRHMREHLWQGMAERMRARGAHEGEHPAPGK